MTLSHLQLKNYFAGYKVFGWQFSPSFGTSNNVISWSQGIHSFCFFPLWPHHEACGILVPSAWVLSHFSCVWFCATLWAIARQAPLSAGFSRQQYCVCMCVYVCVYLKVGRVGGKVSLFWNWRRLGLVCIPQTLHPQGFSNLQGLILGMIHRESPTEFAIMLISFY